MKMDVQEIVVDGKTYVPKGSDVTVFDGIDKVEDLVGRCFYFRLVTYHMLGKVVKIINGEILQLENASWVAESGRFMNAIKEGKLDEVEPVGPAFIILRNCTDFFPWMHSLPQEQK